METGISGGRGFFQSGVKRVQNSRPSAARYCPGPAMASPPRGCVAIAASGCTAHLLAALEQAEKRRRGALPRHRIALSPPPRAMANGGSCMELHQLARQFHT
jgi:hypothetical protein